jgi:hypothetical protein
MNTGCLRGMACIVFECYLIYLAKAGLLFVHSMNGLKPIPIQFIHDFILGLGYNAFLFIALNLEFPPALAGG